MKIEKATIEQIEDLVSISIDAFHSDTLVGSTINQGPPKYDNVCWHRTMQAQGFLYSAIENGTLVGGAILFKNGKDELCVGRIFISPKYQRLGYGIKLMEEIHKLYSECKIYSLDTPKWNIRTNNFYQKLGYKVVKEDKYFNYYHKENMSK